MAKYKCKYVDISTKEIKLRMFVLYVQLPLPISKK